MNPTRGNSSGPESSDPGASPGASGPVAGPGSHGGGGPPRAVVISVGDELLSGETVNTNQAWLGRALSRVGLSVRTGHTVGDVEEEIRETVARGLEEGELVLVTGGLGPTPDDRTKEAVADLLGRELELRQDLYDTLEAKFREWGYDRLPASNRSQAEVPAGAELLRNPRGSAPGLLLEAARDPEAPSIVVLMPGIPREMKAIFEGDLSEVLRERYGNRLRPTYHRMIHTTGIPESALSDAVEAALPEDTGPVSVAFLPRATGADLRLSARGAASEAEAESWLDRIEAALEPVVEGNRYDSPRGDLVDAVARALLDGGRTLAVAESCTGGLLAQRLTARPGASHYFLGGVVCYADESKIRDLGVPEETIRVHGAVSEEVARAMVEGVTERFGSETGIAITGIAGPEGGTEDKPVGTVWYAARVDGETRCRRTLFPGDREAVRRRSAQAALHLLFRGL